MSPPLFLVDEIGSGAELFLGGDEGRHAATVQRLRVGEAVLVSDGAGTIAECGVAEARRDGLRLEVRSRRSVPRPDPRVVVIQALPKGERAELAVEVLTELGVDEIVPWAAARSIAQWRGERADRGREKWRRTVREAAKQSRRAWIPAVAPLASSADVVARLGAGAGLVLHEEAGTPLTGVQVPTSGELVVVVGPEGGLTPDEVGAFTAAGGVAVRLGEPVLRTSTAGAAALAVLSVRLGRWS